MATISDLKRRADALGMNVRGMEKHDVEAAVLAAEAALDDAGAREEATFVTGLQPHASQQHADDKTEYAETDREDDVDAPETSMIHDAKRQKQMNAMIRVHVEKQVEKQVEKHVAKHLKKRVAAEVDRSKLWWWKWQR